LQPNETETSHKQWKNLLHKSMRKRIPDIKQEELDKLTTILTPLFEDIVIEDEARMDSALNYIKTLLEKDANG